MDLNNRVVQVKSTLEPDVEECPTFTPENIGLLFGDIAIPTGLILNKSDPRECFVIFPESGYMPEILKLVEDPLWVCIHMHLTLDRPREGIISIVAKLLEGQVLEEGRNLNVSL